MLIYDLDFPMLTDVFKGWNEAAYRSRQVWDGLYKHFYNSPDQFTNISRSLRERLGEKFNFTGLTVKTCLDSVDASTSKTLFQLSDGNLVEAVLMRYGDPADNPQAVSSPASRESKNRRTLCISTQAGCAMGCVFCATGQMGFQRHLTSGEIVAQVMYYARMLKKENESVTNIVFMGMGEPFHNYDSTMSAIDRLNDPDGYNFGARRFTVSTVGLVPQIRRFADEKRQVNLAISLHEVDDEKRLEIMPVNRRYKIDEVLDACKYYIAKTNRRVSFEWALINGINDTPETAQKLAARLKGLMCHVNAIPLNPTAGYKGRSTDRRRAMKFKETLEQAGIPCTIRMRRGIDIGAGCGQLAGTVLS